MESNVANQRRVNHLSQINVGCELEYATNSPTTFLFQVNVSPTDHQKTIAESLSINRPNMAEALNLGLQQNRAQRCFVQSGSLIIHYEATVELTAAIDFANELFEQQYRKFFLPTFRLFRLLGNRSENASQKIL